MLLYDVFIALRVPQTLPTSFHNTMLTRANLDFARKKIVADYRCLGDASQRVAYDGFLRHCERSLQNKAETPLFPVILNLLKESNHGILNVEEAFDTWTHLFQIGFQDQVDMMAVAPMGRSFVDNPPIFAAFIRCLLGKGVTPVQIGTTYLLQDFFRYHLGALGSPENPIRQLCQLFQACSDTQAIHAFLKTLRCEEDGFASYALDGSIHEGLVISPHHVEPLCFSPNESNLESLYALFGMDFLVGVLTQWEQHQNEAMWVDFHVRLFNDDSTIDTYLSDVLLMVKDCDRMLRCLANLLNERTLARLMQKRIGSVCNLIPYCPGILEHIKAADLMSYLQDIRAQASSALVCVANLVALFDGLRKSNDTAASALVFDALLDAIFSDPSALDDESMLRKLRQCPEVNGFVTQKIRRLEATLELIIRAPTHASLEEKYPGVEDAWTDAIRKIQYLQRIIPVKTTSPTTIYQLYKALARSLLEQNEAPLQISTFVAALGLRPRFDQGVLMYEQLLIELLSTFDDDHLRAQCIAELDTHAPRPWRTFAYADAPLFVRATLEGNIGLLGWLHAQRIKNPISYDKLVLEAARVNQWSSVLYFYKKHACKSTTVKQLLDMAVGFGASKMIETLLSDDATLLDQHTIDKEFQRVVRKNDLKSTECFIRSPRKPCDAVIAKMFKDALESHNMGIASLIAERCIGPCLDAAIVQSLMTAARLNHRDELHFLLTSNASCLDSKACDSALVQATRANQRESVTFLLSFSSIHGVQEALREARKKSRTAIAANLLATLQTRLMPSPVSTEPLLSEHNPQGLASPNSRKRVATDRLFNQRLINETRLEERPIKRVASCGSYIAQSAVVPCGFFYRPSTGLSRPLNELKRDYSC